MSEQIETLDEKLNRALDRLKNMSKEELAERLKASDGGIFSQMAEDAEEFSQFLIQQAYNEAIQFTLECGYAEYGLEFLGCWNEGDWKSIAEEWPEFDINSIAQRALIANSGGMNAK